MFKKYYALATGSFLLIPAVIIVGGKLVNSINPEIAAGHPNYVRNFRFLETAQHLSFAAMLLITLGLWFVTCFFILKSKGRSYWWVLLAMLGPFGFIILTMLSDTAPLRGDWYQQFVRKLGLYLRAAYELGIFLVVWAAAYQTMVLKRNLMIRHEAAVTGTSVAQIINQQNASSGMWAFAEGNEVMYLVVLLYLLLPICFSALGHLLYSNNTERRAI